MTTHRTRRRTTGTAAALVACSATTLAALLTGCSTADAICSDGEYPVQNIGTTGGQCVADGDKVPKGTFRYPEDKTPKHVDDKWDIYWQTHTIDEHGAIIKAPQDS
ncbi:SCO0607 family lipoprotein [Streptomyces griseofuscus]|uniref:SCO0607 family lipoprotein n=1 Tax=Streptomyces griseofuscus TaxID=146922 RepID=UPI0037B86D80